MTTTIKITDDAMQYLSQQTGLEPGNAMEVLLVHCLSLCEIDDQAPAGGVGELLTAAENLLELQHGIIAREFAPFSPTIAHALSELADAARKVREGQGRAP